MKKLLTLFILLNAISTNSQEIHKKYYKNGQLKTIGKYIDGKKTGEWKRYFSNGKICYISNYKNNKPE